MAGGVVAEGLVKRFGDFVAVDGVDFVVAPGTVGGLLGPNGAGKTTTIRILTTLLGADGGRATVAGYDVATEAHAVRSSIALTGQFTAVDDDLTGRENLSMIGRLSRIPWKLARSRADELLERFDLTEAAGRLVRNYSGGMRRRLDLAASLVVSPAVLFLDEPTTGLDPSSRLELWDVVREMRHEGTTIVLTTQYLEEADRLADRISVVDAGHVIAEGTAAELKATIGGEVLEIRARDAATATHAAHVLSQYLAVPFDRLTINTRTAEVLVPLPAGALTSVQVVRILDGAGVDVTDVSIRGSSLDDAFLALTGHTITEAPEPEAVQ